MAGQMIVPSSAIAGAVIMKLHSRDIPYYSQWETADMTLAVYEEGASALLRDPLWAQSGAANVEEYSRWAVNICGMACLKMALASRGELHSTMSLARACRAYGGYVVSDMDASIKGLIYRPFVSFVEERFGGRAEVKIDVDADNLTAVLAAHQFFLASVHSDIRWPSSTPLSKGGHLVLVTGATESAVQFHNPSGHDVATQVDVVLPIAVFGRFFAGRGIALSFDGKIR